MPFSSRHPQLINSDEVTTHPFCRPFQWRPQGTALPLPPLLLAFLAAPCEPGGQRIQSRRSVINNRQCPAFSSRWIPAGPSLEHRQELAASLMACACARPQPSGSYSSGLAVCDDREAMCLGERTGEGEKWKSLLTRARRHAPSSPGLGVSLATCQWAAAPRAPAVKLPISVEARSTSLPVKKKKKKGQGEAVKG